MDQNPIIISPEMYVILQGQIGNIRAKHAAVTKILMDAGLTAAIPFLEEVVAEIDFLQKYLPRDPDEIQSPASIGAKGTGADSSRMVVRSPRLKRAMVDSEEANALFIALCNTHDMTGEMSETLRGMLEMRLSEMESFFHAQIGRDDIPF